MSAGSIRAGRGVLSYLFICAVLAVLETSLSFDNATVNANTLKTMSPGWQRWFLTWGILIAVFGMRILFPLLIVVATGIGPVQAVLLAATDPDRHSHIMLDAYLVISAFGGTFLMMVALRYFFDEAKEVHWLAWIERPLARSAAIRGIEIAVALAIVKISTHFVPEAQRNEFLNAAVFGLLCCLGIAVLGGCPCPPLSAMPRPHIRLQL